MYSARLHVHRVCSNIAARRVELNASHPFTTTMSGFDADRIFTANAPTEARTHVENAPAAVESDLLDFILEFRVGGQFKYRCVSTLQRLDRCLVSEAVY